MEALFGTGFWDHLLLGVSFWPYDQVSINQRNHTGKTEPWWTNEKNAQLKDRFHLDKNLDAVFIDSYAKQDWNLNDPMQQDAFERESLKLWNRLNDLSEFEFKSIQDVIEELNQCNAELNCLSGEVEASISALQKEMNHRVVEIGVLQSDVFSNGQGIKQNLASIQQNSNDIDSNSNAIQSNSDHITESDENVQVIN